MHDTKNASAGVGDGTERAGQRLIPLVGLRPIRMEDGRPDPSVGNAPLLQHLLGMGR